jgi:hypothetical protein
MSGVYWPRVHMSRIGLPSTLNEMVVSMVNTDANGLDSQNLI